MSMQDLENFRDYVRNEYKYKEKYPVIFRSILEEAPKIEGEKHKNATISKRSENYLSCLLKRFAAVFHYLHDIETIRSANDTMKHYTKIRNFFEMVNSIGFQIESLHIFYPNWGRYGT